MVNTLSYREVKDISQRLSVSREDMRTILGISESTQFRYEKKNPQLKPAIADRFERFQRIINQALELFEDQEETQRWLSTPKEALNGEIPLKALATDRGTKKVEEMLYRAEYGIFG